MTVSERRLNRLLASRHCPRLTHWLFALLHEPVLWIANRMDQHVRNRVNVNLLLPIVCAYYRMSLQSAIIGFLVSKLLAIEITPQENVVVQTIAVATGTVCHLPRAADHKETSAFLLLDAAGSGVCWHYPCSELA